METMRDIQIRLKSIDSTRQITESMRLISNRKVQRIKARMQENKPYYEQSLKIIGGMINNPQVSLNLNENAYIGGHKSGQSPDNDVESKPQSKKSLIILISGDRGLCGGYNSNVQKEASSLIKKLGETEIIAIGTKGRDYFRRRQINVVNSYRGLSENPFYEDAQNICAIAVKMFDEQAVNEVYLVYTEYHSMLTQKPKYVRLLPLDTDIVGGIETEAEEKNTDNIKINSGVSYDSGEEAFLKYAVSTYISSSLFGAMLESAVCEQCARLTGMDSAVKNSKKIIDSLTLQYNQMRQSAITQEIAEIVGGANAVGEE